MARTRGAAVIVVMGGTGRVGWQVVSQLSERNLPVRAVSRGGSAAGLPSGAEAARADLADPASLEPVLRDADALFLLWPFTSPQLADGLAPKVAEIAARHASRIVYLSAQPAADRPGSFWALVERAIRESGTGWTFLRPTGFAANTLMWADQIRSGDTVRWPFGAAARSLIDERDIASVAVRALAEEGHQGARYLLSGPEALTQVEQLAAIGHALGRELRWAELSRPEAQQALTAAWGDAAFAASALDTWASFVDHPETVTGTVEQLTGTPARSFADWATDNQAAFR
jgi:uncharacterized protein YbjT (DUF2867 family)